MCTRLAKDVRNVHTVYLILTDVIKPALHLHVVRGHPGTRTFVYIERQVEFDRWGSLTLAPTMNLYMCMSHIPRVNCVLCLGVSIKQKCFNSSKLMCGTKQITIEGFVGLVVAYICSTLDFSTLIIYPK